VSILDSHPENPYRAVDWRFRLAEAILSGQLPPSRRPLDAWVKQAIQFQRDHAAGKGEASIGRSGRLDPVILEAFEIRFSAEPRLRSVLEARVLAGQPAPAIAEHCGLTADVVEAFERLFFDIRNRLAAGDFIRATVNGVEPSDGIPDVDALMKTYAFAMGPLVLDALLAVLDAEESLGRGAMCVATGDEKLIRMAIVARSIAVTAKTAPGLIRLQARLKEIDQAAAAGTYIDPPIRATIEPWPTPAIGEGAGRPVRASAIDLGSATPAEPIREGPGYRAGAITVAFPEPNRCHPEAPIRRTA
jgi:hypothetical protein